MYNCYEKNITYVYNELSLKWVGDGLRDRGSSGGGGAKPQAELEGGQI